MGRSSNSRITVDDRMDQPRIGTTYEASFTVEPDQTISFPGLPAVVATPWLVWHLEMAALTLLAPYLEDGQMSVGTRIEIDHLAPAPEGTEITCRAKVIHIDGPSVSFHIEAFDAQETISRGLHKRHIVEVARMARRIEKKTAGA